MGAREWEGTSAKDTLIIVFVFTGLTFAVLAFKIYIRFVKLRNLGFEDYALAIAFIFSAAFSGLTVVEVNYGQGVRGMTTTADDIMMLRKALHDSIPYYLAGLSLTKIAILLQYKRLFLERPAQWVIVGLTIFTGIYGTWSFVGSILICTPIKRFWDDSVQGSCMNYSAKWYSDAAVNIASDLFLVLFPIPMLKSLTLPKRQKAGLVAVFALGGIASIIAMARLKALTLISNTQDLAKDNSLAAWLSSLELNIGIICASLPSLRAVTLRLWSRTVRSTSPSSTGDKRNSFWPSARPTRATPDQLDMEQGITNKSLDGSAGRNPITTVGVTVTTEASQLPPKSKFKRMSSFVTEKIFDIGGTDDVTRVWVRPES